MNINNERAAAIADERRKTLIDGMAVSIHGLAEDGRNGTVCTLFQDQDDLEEHVWEQICPNDMTIEDLKAKYNGDLSEATEHDGPEYYTWQEDEITIDLAKVPAVADLIRRNAKLEAFRAQVASLLTVADCVVADEGLDRKATDEEIGDYRADMGDDRLLDEFSALESMIYQARALKEELALAAWEAEAREQAAAEDAQADEARP